MLKPLRLKSVIWPFVALDRAGLPPQHYTGLWQGGRLGVCNLDQKMARGTLEDLKHRFVDETGVEPSLPDHWPANEGFVLKVDCHKRVPWLPKEFGQGIKETSNGKTLQAYISPDGKLYYHKKDIEREYSMDLSSTDNPEMDGLGRLVEWEGAGTTDEDKLTVKLDAPAHWPADVVVDSGKRLSWLPADWGTGYRPTNTGKPLRVYISPEGTLRFHKQVIIKEWFNGNDLPELNLQTNGRGDPLGGAGVWRLLEPPDSTPVAKRPRREQEEESQKKEAAAGVREGFILSGADSSWTVIPDDVISVDLDRLASKMKGAGWRRLSVAEETLETGRSGSGRLFSSSLGGRQTKLALKLDGDMKVEGGAESDVRCLAKLYVDDWLWEEG